MRFERVALELGAVCGNCDHSARPTKGKEGKAWCNFHDKIVSTNGVCTNYSKMGNPLAKLYARDVAEKSRVQQTDLFK